MRAVWVYRDYRTNPKYGGFVKLGCELLDFKELATMSAALATWQVLAPEVTRVIYLDSSMYDYLNKKEILGRYNEVVVVDFDKEIDSKYPEINFFAAPKLWALTQQKEPFFLLDTETFILKRLKEWYDEDTFYSLKYSKTNKNHISNWDPKEQEDVNQLKKQLGSLGDYLDPDKMIEAGFTSWPDPKIAREVGETCLEICRKVCSSPGGIKSFSKKWTFCEESILVPVTEAKLAERGSTGFRVKRLTSPIDDKSPKVVECSSPGFAEEVFFGLWGWIRRLTPYELLQISWIDPYYKWWKDSAKQWKEQEYES